MNIFKLVWKNITQQLGSTLLSILLTAFGVAILIVIYITGDTFEKQLANNSKNVDLVVGAKGSPMQLILSTLYHVDNPTGNIPLAEAAKIADNPLVQLATPVSLGDNYKGHRIVGTDHTFLEMYELSINEGKLWDKSFEAVIGAEVMRKQNLKIGDKIFSAHGLSEEAHQHDEHPFIIVGVLEKSNSVVDNLILTNLASIWDVHGIAHDDEHLHEDGHEHHDHDHDTHAHETAPTAQVPVKHDHHEDHSHEHNHEDEHEHHIDSATIQVDSTTNTQNISKETLVTEKPREEFVSEKPQPNFIKSLGQDMLEDQGVEITALLIKYASPAAIAVIPRLVNQDTEMQAASPAIESSRIFSLLGVGLDSLSILAYVIMFIAALSVFISLYNALKERQYDLAIMRTMGASKIKLFTLIIVEGLIITLIGGIIGLAFGHLVLYYISNQTSQSADFIEAFKLYENEIFILLAALGIGIIAALIPAVKAYKTTISKILSSK